MMPGEAMDEQNFVGNLRFSNKSSSKQRESESADYQSSYKRIDVDSNSLDTLFRHIHQRSHPSRLSTSDRYYVPHKVKNYAEINYNAYRNAPTKTSLNGPITNPEKHFNVNAESPRVSRIRDIDFRASYQSRNSKLDEKRAQWKRDKMQQKSKYGVTDVQYRSPLGTRNQKMGTYRLSSGKVTKTENHDIWKPTNLGLLYTSTDRLRENYRQNPDNVKLEEGIDKNSFKRCLMDSPDHERFNRVYEQRESGIQTRMNYSKIAEKRKDIRNLQIAKAMQEKQMEDVRNGLAAKKEDLNYDDGYSSGTGRTSWYNESMVKHQHDMPMYAVHDVNIRSEDNGRERPVRKHEVYQITQEELDMKRSIHGKLETLLKEKINTISGKKKAQKPAISTDHDVNAMLPPKPPAPPPAEVEKAYEPVQYSSQRSYSESNGHVYTRQESRGSASSAYRFSGGGDDIDKKKRDSLMYEIKTAVFSRSTENLSVRDATAFASRPPSPSMKTPIANDNYEMLAVDKVGEKNEDYSVMTRKISDTATNGSVENSPKPSRFAWDNLGTNEPRASKTNKLTSNGIDLDKLTIYGLKTNSIEANPPQRAHVEKTPDERPINKNAVAEMLSTHLVDKNGWDRFRESGKIQIEKKQRATESRTDASDEKYSSTVPFRGLYTPRKFSLTDSEFEIGRKVSSAGIWQRSTNDDIAERNGKNETDTGSDVSGTIFEESWVPLKDEPTTSSGLVKDVILSRSSSLKKPRILSVVYSPKASTKETESLRETLLIDSDIEMPTNEPMQVNNERSQSKQGTPALERWQNEVYMTTKIGKVDIPESFKSLQKVTQPEPENQPIIEADNVSTVTMQSEILSSKSVTPRRIADRFKQLFSPGHKRREKSRKGVDTSEDYVTRRKHINKTGTFGFDTETVSQLNQSEDDIDEDFFSNEEWIGANNTWKEKHGKQFLLDSLRSKDPDAYTAKKPPKVRKEVLTSDAFQTEKLVGKIILPDAFREKHFGKRNSTFHIASNARKMEKSRKQKAGWNNGVLLTSLDVNKEHAGYSRS